MEAAEQFERIMNDSGFVRLRRLSTDEIVGTEKSAGLIERYFSLMPEGDTTLQDIDLSAKEMRIGDNRLCLHTLSDAEDMPGKVATDIRYEKLSTDRSDCRLSFASPVGLLLSCNHIYNQYVIIDNSEENLQKFEKSARNMQSLSRYSRSNSINREWICLLYTSPRCRPIHGSQALRHGRGPDGGPGQGHRGLRSHVRQRAHGTDVYKRQR